jgi:hypothetical protein
MHVHMSSRPYVHGVYTMPVMSFRTEHVLSR